MSSCAGDLLTAQGDVFLSPLCRLLADTPGPAERVLDGNGHKLVLPTGIDAQERLPLILVGAGTTLQLRNITIVHSSSLAACLHLGAGMCARPVMIRASKHMVEQPKMRCLTLILHETNPHPRREPDACPQHLTQILVLLSRVAVHCSPRRQREPVGWTRGQHDHVAWAGSLRRSLA